MKDLVVDFAYFLNTSESYQKTKRFFYNLLENDKYKYHRYFNIVMMILIFTSVSVLIREVKYHSEDFWFDFNEYVITIVFFIEYVLRFWISSSVSDIIIERSKHDTMLGDEFNLLVSLKQVLKEKAKYVFSARAIIDFLAILPFFHELRLLRVFILFRVFKLFRYTNSLKVFSSVFSTKKFELLTLFMFAGIIIFVSSILIYVMEANNPDSPINTLFQAFYWSIVTISTVGYGDIIPVSDEGRVVAMVVIVTGIAVLAFTTSIVVSAFDERLESIKETKTLENISKLKDIYIICGYEEIARELAPQLLKTNPIIVLDEDEYRVERAKKDGLVVLNYDPGSIESYKSLKIDMKTQVKAILCLRESDIENVYTTLTVRSLHREVFILSLLINDIHRNKLEFAGVDEILYAKELVGMMAKEFIGKPVAFEVIHAFRSEHTSINIHEILITNRILANFKMVGMINSIKYRLILLGVHKKEHNRFFFNPLDDTLLEEGDYLIVIGNTVFIKEFEKYLNKKIKR